MKPRATSELGPHEEVHPALGSGAWRATVTGQSENRDKPISKRTIDGRCRFLIYFFRFRHTACHGGVADEAGWDTQVVNEGRL